MTTPSGLVQRDVAQSLKQALREHGGSGDANQETAAMRGVTDFLICYMKNDGKTTIQAKVGGDKMKGEAARLALTALELANKCGGLDIKFHSSENKDNIFFGVTYVKNERVFMVVFEVGDARARTGLVV